MAVPIVLCNEVLHELSFEVQCAEAARMGYDALEIAPFTLGEEPHRLGKTAITRVLTALADAGIGISGLHMLMQKPAGLSITENDDTVATRTREVGEALVTLCAGLGGRYLVHDSAVQRRLRSGAENAGRKRALTYFEAMARAAERANVVYCIEALAPDLTNYVTTVGEAYDIVDAIDSPALRTMVDCCHAARSERDGIPALLRRHVAAGHIAHIHANDPNRRGPGQGDLDFTGIAQAIKETGYHGAVGIEPILYEPDGISCAETSIRYLRSCGL